MQTQRLHGCSRISKLDMREEVHAWTCMQTLCIWIRVPAPVNDECTCIKKQHSIEDRSELTLMDTFAGQPGLLKEVKKL